MKLIYWYTWTVSILNFFLILNNLANSTSSDKDFDKFLHKTKRNSKIDCK